MTEGHQRSALHHWVRALRLPAQINLALPMLVGMVHASPCNTLWAEMPLLKGLLISLMLQAMILYSNDASDASTDDTQLRTFISGGSGVGAEGALSPGALRRAAIVAGAGGLVACAWLGGVGMATVWLVAAALVWAYDGATLRLSRHPLGCLCQAVGVGVVAPLLGAGLVAPTVWPGLHSVLLGLCLGCSGHILSALPDEPADRRVGKRTIVVWLGARASHALMLTGLAAAGVLLWSLPAAAAPCLAAMPAQAFYGWWVWCGLALALIVSVMASVWLWLYPPLPIYRPGGVSLDVWLGGLVAIALWVVWIAAPL